MIKRGSVVFVMHHDNIMSKLIAWFMQSIWSHVALVVDIGQNDTWLCETTDTQVGYGSLKAYFDDSNVSIEIYAPLGVSEDKIEQGIKEAKNNVGSIYAYWQLLSWAVSCLLIRVRIKFSNLLPYGWVCNSHVLDGVREYPIEPFHKIKSQSIHVGHMYTMMKSSPNWSLVYQKLSK